LIRSEQFDWFLGLVQDGQFALVKIFHAAAPNEAGVGADD
jgi:hypothetical protein